jgi:hypothetical protein
MTFKLQMSWLPGKVPEPEKWMPKTSMTDEEEHSNLFAIPDFWRSSSGIEPNIGNINSGNPLFSLDVSSMVAAPRTRSEACVSC